MPKPLVVVETIQKPCEMKFVDVVSGVGGRIEWMKDEG